MENLNNHIGKARIQYDKSSLNAEDLPDDPFELFTGWMKLAIEEKVNEPIAMNLATVSKEGRPSSRIVLLREFSADGFVFYTNYNSRKGRELEENPYAALNFYWHELDKQVRISGTTEKVSSKQSDEYFHSRPVESQLSACVSNQSEPVTGRKELEEKVKQLEERYRDKSIPRPENWGGYLVKPFLFEFWQGRPGRLHDRFEYKLIDGVWKVTRLAP